MSTRAINDALEEIAVELHNACNSAEVMRVRCMTITASATWPNPGEHLLANCLCEESVGASGPTEALRIVRVNLADMLKRARVWRRQVRGFAFQFACPGLPADEAGNTPRKLYWYGVLSEGLDVAVDQIDLDYVASNAYRRQGSEWDAVTQLLS